MSARTIHLYGAKGGVGTSTVAVLIAAELAAAGESVSLYADGPAAITEDLGAILGRPSADYAHPYLLGPEGMAGSIVHVIDHGTTPPKNAELGDETYLVLRGCYLALRRALTQGFRPTGVILLAEPDRSLGRPDVDDVLGVRVVAEIPVEPAIARSIDAGILGRVRPRSATRPLRFLTASRVS